MHKFLKIFSLGVENHSQKTSKSDGFFPENHCRTPPRVRRVQKYLWKRKKITKCSHEYSDFSECKNS